VYACLFDSSALDFQIFLKQSENRTPYLVVGLDARLLQCWASALDVAQGFQCVA
jgi:hypothetical protein